MKKTLMFAVAVLAIAFFASSSSFAAHGCCLGGDTNANDLADCADVDGPGDCSAPDQFFQGGSCDTADSCFTGTDEADVTDTCDASDCSDACVDGSNPGDPCPVGNECLDGGVCTTDATCATLVCSASVKSVPTLSQWGMLTLVTLMLLGGTVIIMRKRGAQPTA